MKIVDMVKENKGKFVKGVLVVGGAIAAAVVTVALARSDEDYQEFYDAGDNFVDIEPDEIIEDEEDTKEED